MARNYKSPNAKQNMRKLPFSVFDPDTGEKIEMPKKRTRKLAKDGTNKGALPIYITPEQWRTVMSVAGLGATDEEIGDAIGISYRTLIDNYHNGFFQAIKKQGKNKGKLSLRRWQFKSAEEGNVTMQIWLGKNILEQKDQQEIQQATDNTIHVSIESASTAINNDDDI